jgi:hypothetical protein
VIAEEASYRVTVGGVGRCGHDLIDEL